MPSLSSPQEIATFIVRRDRAFKAVVEMVGPPPLRSRAAPVRDRFPDLVSSITSQLLATKAADTIHRRVVEACGGAVNVESVIDAGADQLKGAGLNRTKAQAMVDLAQDVREQRVRLDRHGRMSDDEIVRDVASVRGIGPWTAQMYLIFTMGRRDVWPAGDFGVRNGWSRLHDLDEIVSEPQLRLDGAPFEGVRTAVAWYCWRAVDIARQSN